MDIHSSWMTNDNLFGTDYENNVLLNLAKNRFDNQRYNSLEGYSVTIDGVVEQIVIQNHTNPLSRFNENKIDDRIIHCASISNIHRGSSVVWNTEHWLVLSDLINNQVYISGSIQKCNSTLTLVTGQTEVITGYDNLGRPIITLTPTSTSWNCIAYTGLINMNLDQPINLPVGRILISVPYSASIVEGMEFSMYGRNYKIIDTDLTNVNGSVGLMKIFADRKV